MSDLKNKPNKFQRGTPISAGALNKLADATPRLLTGGSGVNATKFGDRVIFSAKELATATPPGAFPQGRKWAFGWGFRAEGTTAYLDIFNVAIQVGQGTVRGTDTEPLSVALPTTAPAPPWGGLVSLCIDFSLFPEALADMSYVSDEGAFTLVWGGRPPAEDKPTTMYIPLYLFNGRVMMRDLIHGMAWPQVWLPYVFPVSGGV